ncbi:MAG: Fis family transcriptional regulator [Thauera sp.]|nr:Fis family transcriptional regulator [Thauera sp.]
MKEMSSSLPTPASIRGNPPPLVAAAPPPPGRHGAGTALDRERLLALSAPAMEDLHRQLDSPTITVLLADSAGSVLRAIGSGGGQAGGLASGLASPAAVRPRGIAASPASPAPSTAAAPAPAVPPGQLGIAVPILPPAGALLGFLDADAAPMEWLGHANALLHTAACIIEHRLIETEPQGFLLLRFHRYASVLGTPLEALVLFDAEGAVILANHTARALLAPCAFSAGGATACFATQWCGIVGYAALGLRQPFVLRDRRGGGFSAQASLLRQTT